jgi:glutaredoxin 3
MLKVEIYTKNGCTYCDRAKQLLEDKEVHFTEIRIDSNPDRVEEMLYRSRGMRSVPQIYINDRLIGGFDDMVALDQAGKLDSMLSE